MTRDRDTGDTTRLEAGQVVDLYTADGTFVARAMADPEARVVARVLSLDRKLRIDKGYFQERSLQALALRDALRIQANCYRLINGEADGLPGVVVDRYGELLVGQLYTRAATELAETALTTLMGTGRFRGAWLKVLPRDRRTGLDEAAIQWVDGDDSPSELVGEEYGVRFKLRPLAGLSTGIFLDHRENRRLVASLGKGGRVLNAFAYTGAFSVCCALEGATVDTVDLAPRAIEIAKENFALNGLPLTGHRFLAEDVFPFLDQADGCYDVVVLDPPTFSTSKGHVWEPGKMTELNAAAMRALKPGGWLVTVSNFSALKEEELHAALRLAGAEARRPFTCVASLHAGPDFPWLPGFPESRHLKGVLARVF